MGRPTGNTLFTVGLLTVPMRIYPATKDGKTRFHQLHHRCLERVQYRKWCPACNETLLNEHIVRGVEVTKGQHVTLDDSELDALPLPSAGAVHVEGFMARSDLPTERLEELKYLGPGVGAARAFALLHRVLRERGMVAVGKMARAGNEDVVAVEPGPNDCFYLWRLYYASELHPTSDVSGPDVSEITLKPQEIALAEQLLGGMVLTREGLNALTDESEAALQTLIAQKTAGLPIAPRAEVSDTAPADLMEALRKTMAQFQQADAVTVAAP